MKYLLPITVFLLMTAIGMSLKPSELLRHWRKLMGWAWLRLLAGTFIIPPVVAMLIQRTLPLNWGEVVGLFLLSVVPGAPLTSRVAEKRGFDLQIAASYQVSSALLMPLMIPIVVYASARLYNRNIWIPPRLLFLHIAENQFLPLLIGLGLMTFATAFANKIRRPLTAVGNVLLLIVILVMLWKMRAALAAITPWVIVGAFILAIASILAITLLLQAEPETNKTVALCNANRHVGLALLLAGQYTRARDAAPAIACYALVAPLVMLAYARIVRRKQAAQTTVA
jgi:BASS family bile acid:Na+ symporter